MHDPELGEAQLDSMQVMLQAAILRLTSDERDPDSFVEWARDAFPTLVPEAFAAMPAGERPTAATWIAREIWNATPLESNGFKPQRLPAPKRNDPCPCGSGRKFKHCCAGMATGPVLDVEAMWLVLVDACSDKYWLERAAARVLPMEGIAAVAFRFRESGRWRALVKLVEPLFDGGPNEMRSKRDSRRSRHLASLIDPLCDAYDALYKTDRKKRDLLTRLATHDSSAIRMESNLRLAAWLHDQGDVDRAWSAWQRAVRAEPDHPSPAALEITMLCSEGRTDQASRRADFWLRRFRHLTDEFPELIGFLEDARDDPQRALVASSQGAVDPQLAELVAWISSHHERALPAYRWVPIDAPDDLEMRDAHELEAPRKCARVERSWQRVVAIEKPFSTEWLPFEIEGAWLSPDRWLAWLQKTPAALDSLSIIDDLLSLILAAEDSAFPFVRAEGVQPLIARGLAILEASQPEADGEATLPWLISENRPALRILSHAIAFEPDPSHPDTQRLIDWYLKLNPNDNHGWRCIAVNQLLVDGKDEAALKLAESYPDDMHAEVAFGRVLALYRLGRQGEAIEHALKAAEELPLVLDYLYKNKVRPPRIDPLGVMLGGKDQAWLYRDAMRETWMRAEGMREWLGGLRKRL